MTDRTKLAPEVAFVRLNEETTQFLGDPAFVKLFEDEDRQKILGRRSHFLARLAAFDKLSFLGISEFYALIAAREASVSRKPKYELEIADVEFLQLLLLQSVGNRHDNPPSPADLEEIWEESRLQYFASVIEDPSPNPDEYRQHLITTVKLHSAFYRNPYGIPFSERMLKTIASKLDNCPILSNDSQLEDFIDFIFALIREINERFGHVADVIKEIHGAKPDFRAIADDIGSNCLASANYYAQYKNCALSDSQFQALCYNMLELSSPNIFKFSIQDIAAICPNPKYDPIPHLKRCSKEFANPLSPSANITEVWKKPFILDDNQFYLFSFYTILSFPFHLLQNLSASDPTLFKRLLEKYRGEYLEEECEAIMRQYFPSSRIHAGVYWYDGSGARMETDLIVHVGNRLVIMECKGAIFPDKLRFGHYARSRSFLRDNFGKGNAQAARLKKRLDEVVQLELLDRQGKILETLIREDIVETISYVVTIDQLGPVANARMMLETSGVAGEDILDSAPMMISELSTLTGFLPNEEYRAHYLSRRQMVYKRCNFVGDESDIFSTYVMYGFTNKIFNGDDLISGLGASYHLKAFLSEDKVLSIPESSTLSNSPYFESVLKHIYLRQPRNYLDSVFAILDTPREIQMRLEEAMTKLKIKGERIEVCRIDIESGVVSLQLIGSRYGAVEREERMELLTRAITEQLESSTINAALLIGRQIGYEDYPYSVLLYKVNEHKTKNE